jgi:exodeoxyribonuclease-3
VETAPGESRFDIEGRIIAAHFRADRGRFAVVNRVTPPRGAERTIRQPGRLQARLLSGGIGPDAAAATPVLVTGDCNTAHSEIDIARPKSNIGNSGFLPEVRAELGRWLGAGWVDTFRAPHADEPDHYTWCRQ